MRRSLQAETPASRGLVDLSDAGRLFTARDLSMAARWFETVRSRGYRLAIPQRDPLAAEVIQIRLRPDGAPVYSFRRRQNAIMATDCIGMTVSFPSLVDALSAVAPLSSKERRFVMSGRTRAFLWPKFLSRLMDVAPLSRDAHGSRRRTSSEVAKAANGKLDRREAPGFDREALSFVILRCLVAIAVAGVLSCPIRGINTRLHQALSGHVGPINTQPLR